MRCSAKSRTPTRRAFAKCCRATCAAARATYRSWKRCTKRARRTPNDRQAGRAHRGPAPAARPRLVCRRPAHRRHAARGNPALEHRAWAHPAPGDRPGARAPYMRRERFAVHRHTAVCLEPRGLLARWDGAHTKLTVSGAAKVPFATRRTLAKNMDLPEECIDMLEPDVGGGFGVRGEFY